MWKKINYEIQGRGHEREDMPCQDKTFAIEMNGVHCMALADGAGSAKLSHIGADVAVKVAAEYLCNNFDKVLEEVDGERMKTEFLNSVSRRLNRKALEISCNIKELASTLMVVAIKEGNYIVFHIGDGVVGALKNGMVKVISRPTTGEYAGCTVFTTSLEVGNYLVAERKKLDGIEGFILMSDGTGESFYNNDTQELIPSTKNFFEYLKTEDEEDMQQLIDNTFKEIIAKRTFDDCSICLIVMGDNEKSYIYEIALENLCERLEIKSTHYIRTKKRLKRYSSILSYTKEAKTLAEIADKLKIKPKYAKNVMDMLIEKGVMELEGSYYRSLNWETEI